MDTTQTLLVPPAEAGGAARIRKACLVETDGPDAGARHVIDGDSFTIGSAPGCDLRLQDGAVSRRHCRIVADACSGYSIEDLGSTNGTFVNGVRVAHAWLAPGVRIQAGGRTLEFVSAGEDRGFQASPAESFGAAVGRSAAMRRVFYLAEAYAPTDATIMITGETGTGKDVLAAEIHAHSARVKRPFVTIDCAALSRELVESELFGHVKGAFTGAVANRAGAFEQADGGTVFLDEIGELPPELQPKLLRALENREVRRVGSNEVRKVDVRILCATNKRLDEAVNEGRFREDLFYRLSVVSIELPPLRERPEDIPPLVEAFARRFRSAEGGDEVRLDEATLDALRRHSWPGNVRELRNLVERAFYSPVRPVDLLACLATGRAALRAGEPVPFDSTRPFKDEKGRIVESFERRYFAELLRRHGGNVSAAAREAKIERAYLQRLVKKFGLRERG